MKKTLSISFVIFSIMNYNLQASSMKELGGEIDHTPTMATRKINHNCPIFDKEDTYECLKEGVVLRIKSSEPLYFEAIPIIFSLDSETASAPVKILRSFETFFNICFGEETVGSIKTIIEPQKPNQVYIARIDINENFQKQGIGTSSIAGLLQFYRQKFNKDLIFWARIKPENIASLKAFSKNGFMTDGEVSMGMLTTFREVSAQ